METNEKLARIEPAQQARLSYLEFCLYFRGHFQLGDIAKQFRLTSEQIKQDIEVYKSLAHANLEFDPELKRYFQTEEFTPIFNMSAPAALLMLSKHAPNTVEYGRTFQYPVEHSTYLNYPDIETIARLVQAILNGNVVNMIYTSLSSGSSARDIVPHSIIDNGLRWHLRAYDRKSESFRDFVLTRISKVSIRSNQIYQHEVKEVDWQWQNVLELELIAHPNNVQFKTAIEMDYGMVDGRLNLKVRAALAGYLLRRWNVDCSSNAILKGPEFQLHLSNRDSLEGAENLSIAPGYL